MLFKKIARISIYVFLSLILILAVLQIILSFYINKRLADDLKERVEIATKHKYSLYLGSASVSVFNRSIVLEDVRFVPKACKDCGLARYRVTAANISLEGVSIIQYLRNRSISASSLTFNDIAINIYQAKRILADGDTTDIQFSLYKVISKKVNELAIESININNTKLKIFTNDSSEVLYSDENNIEVSKFLVNERVDSLSRIFTADKFSITMKTFNYKLPGGLYNMKGKNLVASYNDSLLTVDSLELVPIFNKKDFSDAAGKQVSRIKLNTSGVGFSGMNVQMFLEHNWFLAKKMDVNTMNLNVFRDKNADFIPKESISVQELLRKIPFLILLDTIKVNNADIVYEHLAKNTKKSGKVSFNKLNGTITNFRNDSLSFKSDKKLKMKVNSMFMNKGKLTALYEFPLNTTKEVFYCKGKLVNMSLTELNNMLENTVFVSIKSGELDTLSFAFNATDKESKGKMKFLYHNLKIELLNRDNKKQNLKKKIMSYFANRLLINDQNPKNGNAPLITDIGYKRYPYKYLFYYTWKSLQSGIMPAIGIKNADVLLKQSDAR